MNYYIENPLETLYPEVDPHVTISLSPSERLALAVALGVMAYGAVIGDVIVASAGFALTLIACAVPAIKTPRRIRSQARGRFPGADWEEYQVARRLNLGLIIPMIVGAMGLLVIAGFWYIPPRWSTVGGCIIAVIVATTMWFMPGLNPMWSKRNELPSPGATQTDNFPLQPDEYPNPEEGTSEFPLPRT
ncbi:MULTISPECIES: hypothetical protein [Corynebacterium]|uniref:hypothetical protein n=1 Tax=Corynebacterium TaxID=1716 RepID=UPI0008A1CA85|nr:MULTISPECIES: hypothetical protein [Corynebacterium]OFT87796.1 hypothetical protein HMPREF3098_09180 [Corynebacterium sp. HMSC28B08]